MSSSTYITGRNAVIEALRAGGGVEKVFIMFGQEGDAINRIRTEAKRAGVPCVTADRQRFGEMERAAGLGVRSQGVIALVSGVDYADIELLVQDLYERGETPLVAALDGITDPHNVGAIIRSAECAGLHGILLGKRDSSGITDVVMKTSAGAAGHLPIARASNVGDVLLGLQQEGLAVVGLDERGSMRYTEMDFTAPAVIVIGSEGTGLSARVRKLCDVLVTIPMAGRIASLNASVAAGVVFFEARRQRALGDAETRRVGDAETRRVGDGETGRVGDGETRRVGDGETGRVGDGETRRVGDAETRGVGDAGTRGRGEMG